MRELPGTVAGTTVHEIEIKRSRFITTLAHAPTTGEADAVIAAVRKQYWDARHNCVAMIIGQQADQQRSSDDGEPSGTAGIPMLEVLRHRHLTDVVAVVTRYFGGILLGAGGLVRAYTAAVSETIDQAPAVQRAWRQSISIDVDYAEAGRMENLLRTWCAGRDANLFDIEYGSVATLTVATDPSLQDEFASFIAAASAGATQPKIGERRVTDIPTDS